MPTINAIKKVLIANRGEIACRVIKTLKRLDIDSVAVYSDADRNSQHVKRAEQSVYLGPSPVNESYLLKDKLIEAAKRVGADAIHPGYGFLSENAGFARQCEENGILFIGPPASAIDAMGSKAAAKELMKKAQVPLVPGYHDADQSNERLLTEAKAIGYPVLLKASMGGGGKGMRLVEKEADFNAALEGCRRESMASFGDDHMLIEKYIMEPRHVEIQVFADRQGNAVYLYERDCSIQRRHQKVIEEAPAPGVSEALRDQMGQAAVRAAKAIGYVGAGTIEFLLDANGDFYFMEMNTRLQVEHPVTELITRQDLVEWQIRVTEGHDLPKRQHELQIHGHAFEARIYAETPENDFLPSTGKIRFLREPEQNRHVRIDTGIVENDEVTVFYDPMIAKLIVWDHNRDHALHRLQKALQAYCIDGLNTNIPFLNNVACHSDFENARLSTHFIEQHYDDLLKVETKTETNHYLYGALFEHLQLEKVASSGTNNTASDPWKLNNGWQLNDRSVCVYRFNESNAEGEVAVIEVTVSEQRDTEQPKIESSSKRFNVRCGDTAQTLSAELHGNALTIDQNHTVRLNAVGNGDNITLFLAGNVIRLARYNPDFDHPHTSDESQLTAPMNGRIVDVLVKTGDSVETGAALVIMEAMKMEHTIKAAGNGVVGEIFFQPGDLVEEGAELLQVEFEEQE